MFEVLLVSESSGQHCNIAVHNADNGQCLSTFKGGVSQPATLCVQNEQYIFSATPNKPVIQAFELSRKSQIPVKIPVPGAVSSLSTSNDGTLLAAGIKNDVLVWEILTGDLIGVLSRHYQKVTSLEFSHDDSYLVSGGEDGILAVWDMADVWDSKQHQVEPYCAWTCHSGHITKVVLGLRYRVYSSSLDKSVKIHDVPTKQTIKTIVFDSEVSSFCLNPNETSLYVGSSTGSLVAYDLLQLHHDSQAIQVSSDASKMVKNAHDKKITTIVCGMDGSFIVTGSDDQEVKRWDSGSLQWVKSIKFNGPLTNLLLLPAYHGFTSSSKLPILPLPKLNRQLKASDDDVEESCIYFNSLKS